MEKNLVICWNCGHPIVRDYGDGVRKLRCEIVIWEKGRCFVVCRRCKSEVEVKMVYEDEGSENTSYIVVSKDRLVKRRVKIVNGPLDSK